MNASKPLRDKCQTATSIVDAGNEREATGLNHLQLQEGDVGDFQDIEDDWLDLTLSMFDVSLDDLQLQEEDMDDLQDIENDWFDLTLSVLTAMFAPNQIDGTREIARAQRGSNGIPNCVPNRLRRCA